MKTKRFTIAAQVVVWLLLLVIPYVTTDQVFHSLAPSSDVKYLLLCSVLSTVLIIFFYFNYLFLIPRFLLAKRYWLYFSSLLLIIAVVLFISGAIFIFSDFNPHRLTQINPAIEKIIPVIIINALFLWLLSIASTILWAAYTRLKKTESEKLSAQIASLKSQINPHFLFNTLNNIYAMAIETGPQGGRYGR